MFDEIAWLEQAGHEVAHFSTSHPDNQSSPWSGYFAPYIELGEHAGLAARDRVPPRRACSTASKRPSASGDNWLTFDLTWCTFTVSIASCRLRFCSRLAGPAYRSYRRCMTSILSAPLTPFCAAAASRACHPSVGRRNLMPCVAHRCVRGSVAASAASAAELLWRRWVMGYARSRRARSSRPVATWRTWSAQEDGAGLRYSWCRMPSPDVPASAPGDSFLYAGRLSREKGVTTLLGGVRSSRGCR